MQTENLHHTHPEEWHWVVKEGVKTLEQTLLGSCIHFDYGTWIMTKLQKIPGETISLISELEHEQPGSMFTTTALTFVPIGLLRKI